MNMKHINYIILSAVLTLCVLADNRLPYKVKYKQMTALLPFVNKVVSLLAGQ